MKYEKTRKIIGMLWVCLGLYCTVASIFGMVVLLKEGEGFANNGAMQSLLLASIYGTVSLAGGVAFMKNISWGMPTTTVISWITIFYCLFFFTLGGVDDAGKTGVALVLSMLLISISSLILLRKIILHEKIST